MNVWHQILYLIGYLVTMSDLQELQTALAQMQEEMKKMQATTVKTEDLEKELSDTKKLLESYKTAPKTIYVSRDKKLTKFAGRPPRETYMTVE